MFVTYSVYYIQCLLHIVFVTYSVCYIQCLLHTVFVTYFHGMAIVVHTAVHTSRPRSVCRLSACPRRRAVGETVGRIIYRLRFVVIVAIVVAAAAAVVAVIVVVVLNQRSAHVHQLFRLGSVHGDSASQNDYGRAFPDELCVSSFPHMPMGFLHYVWTALSAHSDFVGSKCACVFICNLSPALLAE